MNPACIKCNLKSLNQYEQFSKGEYAKQFDLSENSQNHKFVKNSYKPQTCQVSDIVCFSLTDGAISCTPEQTVMQGYNISGKLVTTNVKYT